MNKKLLVESCHTGISGHQSVLVLLTIGIRPLLSPSLSYDIIIIDKLEYLVGIEVTLWKSYGKG